MRRLLVVPSVVAVAVVVGVAVGVSTGNAAYPGTNGLILVDAFTSSSQDIATFDPATDGVHYLVRTASFSEHEPRASADGKKIVYVRRVQEYPTIPPGPADIWVMNADGTGQTQLTNNSLDEMIPMFAPDGRILFSRCVDGPRDCDIWIMNGDGSGQKNLTDLDGWQGFPAASPDGKKIAFTSCAPNENCKIWLMKMDGTAKSQLTFGPDVYSQPDWSPGGNSIAFDRWIPNTGELGLMIMKSNGTDMRTLYDAPGKAEQFPTWSPDGTKIAYTDNTGGAGNILILDLATGTSQQVLTPRETPTTEYSFGYPSWIPKVKKTR